jgi:hypothetical protein
MAKSFVFLVDPSSYRDKFDGLGDSESRQLEPYLRHSVNLVQSEAHVLGSSFDYVVGAVPKRFFNRPVFEKFKPFETR